MVLDVFVEGCSSSINVRYCGFTKFRCEIFRGWNEDLGKLYEKKYGFLWDRKDEFGFLAFAIFTQKGEFNSIDEDMKKILNEFDKPYNEGMKLFFYHSDCDGEFTPEECVLVLQSFGRVNPDKFDNSDEEMNEWYRETYDIWIKMLNYAIEHNKPILFG